MKFFRRPKKTQGNICLEVYFHPLQINCIQLKENYYIFNDEITLHRNENKRKTKGDYNN